MPVKSGIESDDQEAAFDKTRADANLQVPRESFGEDVRILSRRSVSVSDVLYLYIS